MVGWVVLVATLWVWVWGPGCVGQVLQCGTCVSGINMLTCPNFFDESRLTVEVLDHRTSPNSVLRIQCRSASVHLNASLLHGCSFPAVRYVMFRYCPMPATPFSEVLDEMGVESKSLISLSFSNAQQRHNETLRSDHLHGLSALKNLEFKENLFVELPADIFEDNPHLEFFSFSFNKLSMLPETLFANTPNLTDLTFRHNDLTSLPDGLLTNLSRLTKLSLYENMLTEVQPQVLAQVPALSTLELSFNRISHLEPNVFASLSNLSKLILNSNNIEELPENILHNCPSLEIFYITYNKLKALPPALFKESKKVQEFYFDNNHVTELPGGLFSGMHNITKLKLKKNGLQFFPSDTFSDLVNLEVLDLQSNMIAALPPGCFDNQRKMDTLILHNNTLLELPSNIFQHCESLEKLYLSNNNLRTLTASSFPHPITVLDTLKLSYNNLSFTTHSFESSHIALQEHFSLSSQTNLVTLMLDHNQISSVPRALTTDFPELTDINLSGNIIDFVDGSELYFKHEGVTVDLRNNRIKTIDLGNLGIMWTGQMVQVQIGGNPLVCDCHLYHLTKLIQHEATLPSLRSHFVKDVLDAKCSWDSGLEEELLLVELYSLTCQALNCIAPCSCVTRPHDQMFVMDCSHRDLEAVPPLQNITSNQLSTNLSITMNLKDNNISSLAGLQQYTSLVNLTAANNSLTSLKKSFLPKSLRALDLRRNGFTSLDQSVLDFLNTTNATLNLGGNPWVCDCELLPLFAFLRDPARNVTDAASMGCRDLDVPLVKALKEDLCPLIKQPRVIITIASTTVLLFIIIVFVTVGVHRYQHDIKVWLFTHRLFLWAITEEENNTNKKYDAFISYSNKDDEFVNNILVPGLESGEPKYKVCLHYRDWMPGEYIQNQIDQSIEASRRTIVVLSKNFIENVWGQIEFKTAHSKALKDKTNRIIVIVFGEIPPESQMDEELKLYLSTRTYLKYRDPKFWEKLRYAMPHPPEYVYRRQKHFRKDKLELTQANSKPMVRY